MIDICVCVCAKDFDEEEIQERPRYLNVWRLLTVGPFQSAMDGQHTTSLSLYDVDAGRGGVLEDVKSKILDSQDPLLQNIGGNKKSK